MYCRKYKIFNKRYIVGIALLVDVAMHAVCLFNYPFNFTFQSYLFCLLYFVFEYPNIYLKDFVVFDFVLYSDSRLFCCGNVCCMSF